MLLIMTTKIMITDQLVNPYKDGKFKLS